MQISEHIRWVRLANSVVILSLKTGRYYGVAGSAQIIWTSLAEGKTALEAARRVAAVCHIPENRVIADVENFVADCVGADFLSVSQNDFLLSPLRQRGFSVAPFFFLSIFSIMQIRWLIWRGGFTRAYELAKRIGEIARPKRASALLAKGLAAFLKAEALLFSRLAESDCLPRSLALYTFLRRAGFEVTHIIGVSGEPFTAHAWVTHPGDGVLLHNQEAVDRFVPISCLSPQLWNEVTQRD